jgi:hypothetical protein
MSLTQRPRTSVYHISASLRLTGPLVVKALERSLATIAARHESLRTVFDIHDGITVQLIKSSCRVPLHYWILARIPPGLGRPRLSLARLEIKKNPSICETALLSARIRRGPEHIQRD